MTTMPGVTRASTASPFSSDGSAMLALGVLVPRLLLPVARVSAVVLAPVLLSLSPFMIRCPSSVCPVVQITRQDLGGLHDSA
jgi:hypothetical protein